MSTPTQPEDSVARIKELIYSARSELYRALAGYQIDEIMGELQAAILALVAPQQADPQLCKFYGVTTDAELIAAQARHIERLQAKLPPTPSLAPQRVRKG